MRITAPSPGSRVRLDEIDLADTDLYVNGDAHLVWQTLRAERPIFWQERPDAQGFWAVTRRADVRRVLAEYETFSSEGGTAIAMLGGADPAAGFMMHSTDPPRQQRMREQLGPPFSARAVLAYTSQIRLFVREAMGPAVDGEVWDVAESFARLPMAVGAMLMGLPKSDIDPLLRLAYASLAPRDPRYSSGPEKNAAIAAHYKIIEYFGECINERKKNLSTDVISHLITLEVEGERLTDKELLLNCLSLLLGAVVTTSQAINATLIALAEQHGGEGNWPPDTPVQTAVEEALRWSSPVSHFMRRARRNTEMHGRRIRTGDAVTAWIGSANRDETVFERPYTLDLRRAPNRHLAFGIGPHRCLGSHLARLMLRQAFEELMTSVESFELAGTPSHLVSNEIAGVVSLPLRLRLRPGAEATLARRDLAERLGQ
jgi:cytochrome P450